jgi:branched-chain amino acid transport system substrate-binding protein
MKAAREQNLDAPFQLVLIGPTHEFFAKMFGPNLNGIVTIGHWSPFQAKCPKALPFYEAYTKKFNESPDYLDVPLAYMSCEILAQAVAKVGLDKDKLRNEIASDTFDTIDGPVKFDGVQNVSTPTMFLQLQDGKAQIVWPKAEATASFRNKSPWAN